ncbi:diaminopimelate epimerase [Cyanobium sp. Morenito 9A2]|uniref:diaminopimelate epimerase n=1 Tax=Cyanobium sp. Morenito 9A2 TaxID=2823718 RepID=UPI0020CDA854|nr:diaminopimelate epimerase [Cyanobium sp. Morenito 9A2]MCP9850081.1 diaminopimelate epimerase [Cyanobium sp. Morenito 9A2]
MLQFSKYQGLGNDFLLLDGRTESDSDFCFGLTPALVRQLCDRRFGVGADGVILALPPAEDGELRMRIFNADGTEPEMCGNGIRCLARFLADSDGDAPGRTWQVETLAGRIVPELRADGSVRVDMGEPVLDPAQVPTLLPVGPAGLPQGEVDLEGERFPVAAAGMGNPHVVVPVADVAAIPLERYGPFLEHHPSFPARTNVHFVQVLSPTHLRLRVWERGAGPTLACGTGACATLVAMHRLGLCEAKARLDLPGGPLQIAWDPSSNHLFMTGPAELVFDGVLATEENERHQPREAPEAAEAEAAAAPSLPFAPAKRPPRRPEPALDPGPVAAAVAPEINCAVACARGCVRPEACVSAEARSRVAALLSERSLDDLVSLASSSLESRSRIRQQERGARPEPLG